MTTLSYAQLEQVWLQASSGTKYHTQQWAALMAAIAEAESSGRTDAANRTDNGGRQTSWGLWQISNGTHSEVSPNWQDPVTNAQLAIQKLNTQGLGAWGTYTSGAYKSHLQGNVPPGTGSLPSGGQSATLTGFNPNPGNGGEIGSIVGSIIPGFGQIWGGIFGSGGAPQTDIGAIATDIQVMIKATMWLYNPANWVRIGAFFLGLILLAGAGWMFKEAV